MTLADAGHFPAGTPYRGDDPEAYAYLAESVRTFPGPRGLAEMMDRAAGL